MRYRFGEFELDTQRELLIGPSGVVSLRPQAFRLLRYLVERAPALVARDQLMDELWGHHALSPNVIPQTVSELRQALGDDPQQPRFIETRHRRGYSFIGAIEAVAEAIPAPANLPTAPTPEPADTLPAPTPAATPARAWTAWLAAAAILLFALGWMALRSLPPREQVSPPPAAAPMAIRLDQAPPALGSYLGLLARSGSDWVLYQPGAPALADAWTLAMTTDGRWHLRDEQGQSRSSGVLPQADAATQAQTLLRALEAPLGRVGLARDPPGWPVTLEGRQALVDAALAAAEQREGDALVAHERAAEASSGPGWPMLLYAEALARSGNWRAASERLASLRGDVDRTLSLQIEVLRARLRGRPADILAAQTAFVLLLPPAIDARLEVLDLQLAMAAWPAAADSLEALGAALGENSPALAWRRARWLGAMQPGDAPAAFDWAIRRADEAGDSLSLHRARLELARWQLGRSDLDAAEAALQGLTEDPEVLELRAQLALEHGQLAAARSQFESAEAIWRSRSLHGDARRARLGLVEVALRTGAHDEAKATAEALVVEASRSGDMRLDGGLNLAIGRAQTGSGQLELARVHLQRAIDLARAAGDVAGEAHARYRLGNLHAIERRPHEAEQAYRLAAESYRSLRDDRGEASALANLALMAERAGRRTDAREAYRDAVARLEGLGNQREIGRVTFNLGVCERDLGQLAQAALHFDAAAAALEQAGTTDIRVMVAAARADLALLQGDPVTARQALDAVTHLRAESAWLPQSAGLTAMARLRELAGDLDDARELLREALAIRERAALRVAILDVELRLLRLDLASGRSATQSRLAAESIESELLRLGEAGYALGASLAALEAAWYMSDVAAVRTRLQELRVPVQSRGTRTQQLQFEWLQALAGEDDLRRGRLEALERAAAADGYHLLARLARRELLAPVSPERVASDSDLARDGLAGAARTPTAAF
mgnify:FL=1